MIQKLATFLANILRFHKSKIAVAVLSALIFAVLIFPYDDLSDLVTSMIAKASQNQVYVQFDSLGIDLLPAPAFSLENVELDTPVAQGIEAGSLSLAPSIPSLLLFKLGITARLNDFLNGDFVFSFNSENSLKQTDGSGHYEISGESLDLAQVSKMLDLDLPLKGRLSFDGEGDFDAQLEEPARAEFDLAGQQIELLPSMLNIPQFGPMNLPGLKLSQVGAKGRFLPQERGNTRGQLAQELILEEVILGTDRDELQGRVRGKMEVRLQGGAGNLRASLGEYDLRVQLIAKPSAQKDFGLFLSFLDSHKKETAAGSVYQFRVTARAMGLPPSISTLQVFQ